jgi:KDO2-lipid IV(A) lauroyltransferase
MADPRDTGFDALTLAGYRAASLFAKLTPAPLALGTSLALGAPLALGFRDKREMIERHLRRVNPSLRGFALRQAVQESFQSYTRYYLETFRLGTLSKKQIQAGFTVDGFEHIEKGIADGKGVVLGLPHLGGWEWAGRWLVDQGYGLTAVVERLDNDECTTVPAGPAFFALRTGAALLPLATYFTRKSDGHHAVVRPPIPVERQGSLREDVARITQLLMIEVEGLIRRAPEQWHLFQPNWPSDPGFDR